MTGIGVELLGVIAVGIGMAAALFASLHLARKLGLILPRWLLPAGIGLSMIVYSVWNDYAWVGRAIDRLPDGAQILMVGTDRQPWAPWTYLRPVEVRLAALDPAQIEPSGDSLRHAPIILVERRGPTLVVRQEFDCARGRMRMPQGDWQTAMQDDPALQAVCADDFAH